MLTVCGAPVGKGEVGAREILLRVSLVTLRCICVSAQLMGRSAWRFSIDNEGCVSVTGRGAHLNRAVCRRTARLIIDWNLNWKWRVGEIEAKRRFFELSKGESGRMAEETNVTLSRDDLPGYTKTRF